MSHKTGYEQKLGSDEWCSLISGCLVAGVARGLWCSVCVCAAQGAEAQQPAEERRQRGRGRQRRRAGRRARRRLPQDADGGRARAAPPPPRQERYLTRPLTADCVLAIIYYYSVYTLTNT